MEYNIVIADDHPLFRTALSQTIQGFDNPNFQLFCTPCESLKDVIVYLDQDQDIHLVLLDLHMPDSNGFAGLTDLRANHPEVPVAIISGDVNQNTILRAKQFGAIGYLPKTLNASELQMAIENILIGTPYFETSPRPEDQALQEAADRLASLTPHQYRVFTMLSKGLLNKQIAHELAITEPTVKSHVTAILRKLGLRKRTEAIIFWQKLEVHSETHGGH